MRIQTSNTLPPRRLQAPPARPADSPVKALVIDDFWQVDKHTTHGELVQFELERRHDTTGTDANLTVDRKHVSLWTGHSGIEENKPGALNGHLQRHFKVRLDRDAAAFAEIVQSGQTHTVIHQSQGASQSRVVEGLWNRAKHDQSFRANLQRQLEIAPTESFDLEQKRELLSALSQECNLVHTTDPEVRTAIENLREQQELAHGQGHIHVISAGNQGALGREMKQLGVSIPDAFFVNEMAGPHSIIVGASDDGSQEAFGHSAHTVAHIASPRAGAMLAADGVDRPMFVDGKEGLHTGSSYAAPQVSSAILTMQRSDRDLTRDEALKNLSRMIEPLPGAEDFLGTGYLRVG